MEKRTKKKREKYFCRQRKMPRKFQLCCVLEIPAQGDRSEVGLGTLREELLHHFFGSTATRNHGPVDGRGRRVVGSLTGKKY